MEQLIIDYPKATVVVGTFLIYLLVRIIFLPYKQLIKSIDTLSDTVVSIQKEISEGRTEAKKDREADREALGFLYDRMKRQETICEMTHQICPHTQKIVHANVDKEVKPLFSAE